MRVPLVPESSSSSQAGEFGSGSLFTTWFSSLLELQWIFGGYNNCNGRCSVVACYPLAASLSTAPLTWSSLPVISFVTLPIFQKPLDMSESCTTTISPLWTGEDCFLTLGYQCVLHNSRIKVLFVFCLMTSTDTIHLNNVVDCTKYSSVNRLYQVTTYVLRFISSLKDRSQPCQLTQHDLARARQLWILECQSALMKDKNFSTWQSQTWRNH